MKQEVIDEALEQIHDEVLFGFDDADRIFEDICDMFYEEEDFDKEWLRKTILEQFNYHQIESKTWKKPTDFDRLAEVFDELIERKIVCIHKAGYTKQDGQYYCEETINKLAEVGVSAIGYCFYHTQDLMRAIDPSVKNLLLGFDSVSGNDDEALAVGNTICEVLRKHNFEIIWNNTVDVRIEIETIDWKKIPDLNDWGMDRNIKILTLHKNEARKPFWKFW